MESSKEWTTPQSVKIPDTLEDLILNLRLIEEQYLNDVRSGSLKSSIDQALQSYSSSNQSEQDWYIFTS